MNEDGESKERKKSFNSENQSGAADVVKRANPSKRGNKPS